MKNNKQSSTQFLLGSSIAAILFIMISCSDYQTTGPSDSSTNSPAIFSPVMKSIAVADRPDFVPGEVIVKFRSGATESRRANALNDVTADVRKRIHTPAMKRHGDNEGLSIIKTSMSVTEAIENLRNSADVEFAEPNYYVYHDATSNDPLYTDGYLWGMYGNSTTPSNSFGSQAGEAWANGNTGSSTVHIGVIDEGVMYDHEDLAGQIWTNPYDPEDGIDNDGNGYIDDIHGWDFDGDDNSTYDNRRDDHGTHVSGTIGAIGNNGVGVVGVAWNVTIITAKFLGRRGGTTANAILAIDYITDLKTRHSINIPATNNSWGGGGYSQGLRNAIERANDADILFVAAAGNSNIDNDSDPHYPSSYTNDNIISVGGLDEYGDLYWTSSSAGTNYGATSVDLGAPAEGIYSTLPPTRYRGTLYYYGGYNGTSMATPHVTGGVALYSASNPNASAATVKNAILNSTIATQSLSGKTVTGGRLNLSNF